MSKYLQFKFIAAQALLFADREKLFFAMIILFIAKDTLIVVSTQLILIEFPNSRS